MPPRSGDDITKQDLERNLESYAKTIELQILISQQQNRLVEQISLCLEKIKDIDAHFSNGFRSELKIHMTQEIRNIKEVLTEMKAKMEKGEENSDERCRACVSSFNEGVTVHDERAVEILKSGIEKTEELREKIETLQEKIEEIDRRSWQQMWIWGGIALFTLVNAVILIVGLWQNAWIIKS